MESLLFRTGSGSLAVQTPPVPTRCSLTIQDYIAGAFSAEKIAISYPRIALLSPRSIRRVSSESDLVQSPPRNLGKLESRSFSSPRLPEEDGGFGGDRLAGGSPGGGKNRNGNISGGGKGDGGRRKIAAYFQEMLRTDPTNALFLRNYAKYLHEVERDVVKAEEYYERAILASPGDGEVLSLYAKLTWEARRDKARANCYFNQALQASPNDCTILGWYAHFLWEAEEEEEEEEDEAEIMEMRSQEEAVASVPAMVEAF